MKPVVIVGGGLSGLAAGVTLAQASIPVLILEQRPAAGGRAYSFQDPTTGDIVDNGQHLLIAGYARTMRYLHTIGRAGLVTVQPVPELVFHHPRRGFLTLRLARLPVPLNLLWGILRSDVFANERLRFMRAGLSLVSSPERFSALTVADWLRLTGQSEELCRGFWVPLTVSIMNERPDAASAKVFLASLRQAFLDRWNSASLVVPSVGLSELFVRGSEEYIRQHGGEVICNADVVSSAMAEGRVTHVSLRDGRRVECSSLILAVPPDRIQKLLPAELRAVGYAREIAMAETSPIICINLWYERDFMRHEVLGLIGRGIQWVFRRKAAPQTRAPLRVRIAAVISAATEYVRLDNARLARLATDELAGVFGDEARDVRHSLVIREKRATFSLTPAVEPLRPPAQTPVRNLLVAGDWTRTGLPATVEGAILSGERAADLARARGQEADLGGEVAFR